MQFQRVAPFKQLSGAPVELITRPTGLLDPVVELHPIEGQMQHLMQEAKKAIEGGSRVLVTILTKRMAEDLTDYLVKEGFRVRYMHSEVDILDRIELVRQLRVGDFDVLVGAGCVKNNLFLESINRYNASRLASSANLSVLRAWIVRFKEEYLANQTFLEPYPRGINRFRSGS
jgi:excinuclease UvrABC helicase subunit UvrB